MSPRAPFLPRHSPGEPRGDFVLFPTEKTMEAVEKRHERRRIGRPRPLFCLQGPERVQTLQPRLVEILPLRSAAPPHARPAGSGTVTGSHGRSYRPPARQNKFFGLFPALFFNYLLPLGKKAFRRGSKRHRARSTPTAFILYQLNTNRHVSQISVSSRACSPARFLCRGPRLL